MKFEEMNLSKEILQILNQNKVVTPTKIQEEVIPAIIGGKDVLAQSETGSGKTLGFAIPIIEKIESGKGVKALVLAPTRELAQQIANEFYTFSRHRQLKVLCVYGGVAINPQLDRAPFADIVVGTPGRILDLLNRRGLNLSKVKWSVLDEADRMLDMGFIEDIQQILDYTPAEKQTLFFSATIPQQITKLSHKYLRDPVRVKLESTAAKGVLTQYYYSIAPNERFSLLVHLLNKEQNQRTLVFCKTRNTCQAVSNGLRENKFNADCLHGGMTQAQRDRVITLFKEGKLTMLIATDVAARGLHIDQVTHVYNYELPMEFDSFVHRVGRTARAGETGIAVSFVNIEDRDIFTEILRAYDSQITKVDPGQFPRLNLAYNRRGNNQGGGFRGGGRGFQGHGRSGGQGGGFNRGGNRGQGGFHGNNRSNAHSSSSSSFGGRGERQDSQMS